MKGIGVGLYGQQILPRWKVSTYMHVQRVDTQIVRCQIDGLEHFFQCEMLAVTEQDYFIWRFFHLGLDKA